MHTGPVHSVSLSSDGHLALTASWDGTACLWSTLDGKELRRFRHAEHDISSSALSPDGRRVLTGTYASASLWDADSGAELQRFEGHHNYVWAVALSPDGTRVLTGSRDTTARLWSAATGAELCRLTGDAADVKSVSFSPDGARALTCSGNCRIWDLDAGQALHILQTDGCATRSACFCAHGHLALAGTSNGATILVDAETGLECCRFAVFHDGAWAVWDPAGRYDASDDGCTPHIEGVAGERRLPLAELRAAHYDPGLLAKHMRCRQSPLRQIGPVLT